MKVFQNDKVKKLENDLNTWITIATDYQEISNVLLSKLNSAKRELIEIKALNVDLVEHEKLMSRAIRKYYTEQNLEATEVDSILTNICQKMSELQWEDRR